MRRPARASARSWLLLDERIGLFVLGSVALMLVAPQHWLSGGAAIALIIAVVAIAVWHGAYDHVYAEPLLSPRLGRAWLPVFAALYLALAGVVLLGWWLFPLVSLVLFLGYSAWHFGGACGFRRASLASGMTVFALGAAPVLAACRWHPTEVVRLFSLMLQSAPAAGERAAALTALLGAACWPVTVAAAGAVAAICMAEHSVRRARLLVVLVTELVLFRQCTPLIAFAVYFCLWHTPEHLIATSARIGDSTRETMSRVRANLRAGLVPWLIALAGSALFALLSQQTAATEPAQLFIVLSALTVPHMVVSEWRRLGAES